MSATSLEISNDGWLMKMCFFLTATEKSGLTLKSNISLACWHQCAAAAGDEPLVDSRCGSTTVNAAWKLHNLHLTQAVSTSTSSSCVAARPVMAAVLCCEHAGRDYGKHRYVVGVWPPFLWVGRGEMIARAAVRQGVWGAGIVLLLLCASLFVSGTI